MTNLLKVGDTVLVSFYTDDDDLADFLEEHGNQIIITELEKDGDELTGNFWGISTDGTDCPYHIEYRDLV